MIGSRKNAHFIVQAWKNRKFRQLGTENPEFCWSDAKYCIFHGLEKEKLPVLLLMLKKIVNFVHWLWKKRLFCLFYRTKTCKFRWTETEISKIMSIGHEKIASFVDWVPKTRKFVKQTRKNHEFCRLKAKTFQFCW